MKFEKDQPDTDNRTDAQKTKLKSKIPLSLREEQMCGSKRENQKVDNRSEPSIHQETHKIEPDLKLNPLGKHRIEMGPNLPEKVKIMGSPEEKQALTSRKGNKRNEDTQHDHSNLETESTETQANTEEAWVHRNNPREPGGDPKPENPSETSLFEKP